MKPQHTLGPWEAIGGHRIRTHFSHLDPDRRGHLIAEVPTTMPDEERIGNVNLIACAPELLAMLEAMIDLAEESMRLVPGGQYDIDAELADARALVHRADSRGAS